MKVAFGYEEGHLLPPYDNEFVDYDHETIDRILERIHSTEIIHNMSLGDFRYIAQDPLIDEIEVMGSWGEGCVSAAIAYALDRDIRVRVDPDYVTYSDGMHDLERCVRRQLRRYAPGLRNFSVRRTSKHLIFSAP